MAIIVNPKYATVEEMENSSTIALTIEDESGNETKIYFTDYETFFGFSQAIRHGGTYGKKFNLMTSKNPYLKNA